MNPEVQLHVNEPGVLVHSAYGSHGELKHSSTSAHLHKKKSERMRERRGGRRGKG